MRTQRAPIQKKVWKSVSRRAQNGIQMRPLGIFGGSRAANLTIFRVPKNNSKKVTKKSHARKKGAPPGRPYKETKKLPRLAASRPAGLQTGNQQPADLQNPDWDCPFIRNTPLVPRGHGGGYIYDTCAWTPNKIKYGLYMKWGS